MKEAAELRDPTEHYHAQPLEVSPPPHSTALQYLSVFVLQHNKKTKDDGTFSEWKKICVQNSSFLQILSLAFK